MHWALLLIAFLPFPALAEEWSGIPRVINGDSIVIAGQQIRPQNIDAFETEQTCIRDGQEYRCGIDATFALIGLIRDREVTCEGQIRDRYGRVLSKCRIGGLDLGSAMVRAGWAVAECRAEYRPDQDYAHQARLGAWAGTFERSKEWRMIMHAPGQPKGQE